MPAVGLSSVGHSYARRWAVLRWTQLCPPLGCPLLDSVLPAVGLSSVGHGSSPAVGLSAVGHGSPPAVGLSAVGHGSPPAVGLSAVGHGSPPAVGLSAVGHGSPPAVGLSVVGHGSPPIVGLSVAGHSSPPDAGLSVVGHGSPPIVGLPVVGQVPHRSVGCPLLDSVPRHCGILSYPLWAFALWTLLGSFCAPLPIVGVCVVDPARSIVRPPSFDCVLRFFVWSVCFDAVLAVIGVPLSCTICATLVGHCFVLYPQPARSLAPSDVVPCSVPMFNVGEVRYVLCSAHCRLFILHFVLLSIAEPHYARC